VRPSASGSGAPNSYGRHAHSSCTTGRSRCSVHSVSPTPPCSREATSRRRCNSMWALLFGPGLVVGPALGCRGRPARPPTGQRTGSGARISWGQLHRSHPLLPILARSRASPGVSLDRTSPGTRSREALVLVRGDVRPAERVFLPCLRLQPPRSERENLRELPLVTDQQDDRRARRISATPQLAQSPQGHAAPDERHPACRRTKDVPQRVAGCPGACSSP